MTKKKLQHYISTIMALIAAFLIDVPQAILLFGTTLVGVAYLYADSQFYLRWWQLSLTVLTAVALISLAVQEISQSKRLQKKVLAISELLDTMTQKAVTEEDKKLAKEVTQWYSEEGKGTKNGASF